MQQQTYLSVTANNPQYWLKLCSHSYTAHCTPGLNSTSAHCSVTVVVQECQYSTSDRLPNHKVLVLYLTDLNF